MLCLWKEKKKDKMLCSWLIKLSKINIFHKGQLKDSQEKKY